MQLRLAACALLLVCRLPAIQNLTSGTTQWDVRTTGNAANGGCYEPAAIAPGTDYSQQNSPQIVYTDLVIGGTATQLTSVLNPFTSLLAGNCIQIVSGTGFTSAAGTNIYEILSVSGVTATMDRAVGTGGSTGGHGNLGGSLSSPYDISPGGFSFGTNGTVNIQTGTYAFTSMWDACHGSCPTFFRGYGTTHGDAGARPLITTATGSTNLIRLEGETWRFENVAFSNTAMVRARGFYDNDNSGTLWFRHCLFDGFTTAIDGSAQPIALIVLEDSEIENSSLFGADNAGQIWISGSSIHANRIGIQFRATTTSPLVVTRSLIYDNSTDGILLLGSVAHPVWLENDDFHNNSVGLDGNVGITLSAANNIVYGNAVYGWLLSPASVLTLATDRTNAFGANGADCSYSMAASCVLDGTDLALSASPFANAAAGNFALNTAAGGGALLRAAGFPGVFPGALSTGYVDIGAVQSPSAGAFAFAAP